MSVSYARSTYKKAKQFQEKLKELQKTISPAVIRAYLAVEDIQKDEAAKLSLKLGEGQREQLDELKALRVSGIQAEMQHALAQAKINGIQLPEQVVSGRAIVPGFDRELMERVPSLGVYQLFMPYTKEEFERSSSVCNCEAEG